MNEKLLAIGYYGGVKVAATTSLESLEEIAKISDGVIPIEAARDILQGTIEHGDTKLREFGLSDEQIQAILKEFE